MEYRLDETDRQLLRLLQTNARASTAHLARQMNLARTTVVARIAKLEQEGVIAGYGVRLLAHGAICRARLLRHPGSAQDGDFRHAGAQPLYRGGGGLCRQRPV